MIGKNPKLVKSVTEVFEADWARTDAGRKEARAGAEQAREERPAASA